MAKVKAQLPVEKNQYVELDITGQGHEGEGVGRYQDYTLFVPGAIRGERIRAKVTKVNKNYGFARLVEVLQASEFRAEPPCPIYHRCGGCNLQHMTYEGQLAHKRQLVVDALARIGKLEDVEVLPVLGMDEPWKYRNKSQVPVGLVNGKVVAGFYAPRTHEIIDMEGCLIQHPYSDEIVGKVKRALVDLGIPVYDEVSHQGLVRHIVARVGYHTGETMVVLVTNGRKIPRVEELVSRLRMEIGHLVSIIQNVNTAVTNVIFGPDTYTLWGKDRIEDRIGDVRFSISARSFFQVNPVQTEVLYGKALEYAQLTGKETVIDAYCGIGTISLFLARKAKHVVGVEVVEAAIEDAKRNAELNGIENVGFLEGEAEKVIPRLYEERGLRADVVVVDPPRKGCDEALLSTIVDMRPERVVYVSCNPSTLARDLRFLEDRGYKTQEVQPVDMFPHTYHVECVTLLTLK
ncbi:23S rRNA (uracil(1939)-C(5))-methyltransferase RlmD [Effusibacillus lacus]|uniref:23S rRNA (Uracil-5-)-methyltransferase RumA n=1 Tax=Effusibacillus lacus TaxID=1348429 RepID=A0A292YE72_9BACL|nr:23S rRNA (uracil(1939)-C(5))-methyltransferase RlmD [Effusibacillus lacus]TCS76831.1 23S rRNA m(5)U-1939 methyltransferase [Effusibacillus lacus]GAX91162.1 23S rRNA (uracil-5-)-methyltransferase RumA [Effusibacillus lacus]